MFKHLHLGLSCFPHLLICSLISKESVATVEYVEITAIEYTMHTHYIKHTKIIQASQAHTVQPMVVHGQGHSFVHAVVSVSAKLLRILSVSVIFFADTVRVLRQKFLRTRTDMKVNVDVT